MTFPALYPARARFPGHRYAEDRIAAMYGTVRYPDYDASDVARVRALPPPPAPPPFAPRSHRYLGRPTFEHRDAYTPKRRYGPYTRHQAQEASP
jgi:hypothetical protein